MSQRMGGCAAAWQAVRGAPESREHVVTGTGVAVGGRAAVGMKALAPHLIVALEELALLGDAGQKMQKGAQEKRKTESSHSSPVFTYQKRHRHTQQGSSQHVGVTLSLHLHSCIFFLSLCDVQLQRGENTNANCLPKSFTIEWLIFSIYDLLSLLTSLLCGTGGTGSTRPEEI